MDATNVVESGEVWKDIPGFEGRYQASNLGNIRSIDWLVIDKGGYSRLYKGKVFAKNYSNGYLLALLTSAKNKKNYTAHRLVMLTFQGACPPKHEVNHINGIKDDNRLVNLEYLTPGDNQRHAYQLGLKKPRPKATNPRKSKHNRITTLSPDQVIKIRSLRQDGMLFARIAKKLGITVRNVINAVNHPGYHWIP